MLNILDLALGNTFFQYAEQSEFRNLFNL